MGKSGCPFKPNNVLSYSYKHFCNLWLRQRNSLIRKSSGLGSRYVPTWQPTDETLLRGHRIYTIKLDMDMGFEQLTKHSF
ncbi:unnamed protein product [Caretta caretta]